MVAELDVGFSRQIFEFKSNKLFEKNDTNILLSIDFTDCINIFVSNYITNKCTSNVLSPKKKVIVN